MDCFQNVGGITVYFVFGLFAFRSYLPLWVSQSARADSFCLPHFLIQSFHKDQLHSRQVKGPDPGEQSLTLHPALSLSNCGSLGKPQKL